MNSKSLGFLAAISFSILGIGIIAVAAVFGIFILSPIGIVFLSAGMLIFGELV